MSITKSPKDGLKKITYAPLTNYILVACVAAATLGLELVQTRILSFLYYNNVVYLTVTIVLLGFGISGVFVSLFSSNFKNPQRIISLLTVGFIFSPILCLSFVSHLPEYFPSNFFSVNKLFISYALLIIPFIFSGSILGWVFTIHAKSINRLYGVDLACSSLAVLAFVLLLWPLGADWFIWLCCGLVLVGFLFYSHNVLPKRWILVIITAYVGLLLLINGHLIGNVPEAYKTLGREINTSATRIEATAWMPITRIDVSSVLFPTEMYDLQSTDFKTLTQDGTAPTFFLAPNLVHRLAHDIAKGKLFRAISLIYYLNVNPKNALVIGVGGGTDMLTAKLMGAQQVTGVEINPATVSLITGPYRDYLLWPNWSGVKIVRAEGRNYIHSKSDQYNTIVMSGIDTFSALSSGAYVLSENYLYTVEAMKDYLHALKPNGTMGIFRWLFLTPRESLRLASIYLEAAKELNIAHPEQSIMIVADKQLGKLRWAATFLKKRPFTQMEINQILSLVSKEPSMTIIYLPKVFPTEIQQKIEEKLINKDLDLNFASLSFNKLINSSTEERESFIRDYIFRIDPVYDNRPFFFEYYKDKFFQNVSLSSIRGPTVLYALLIVCASLCLYCIMFPLWVFQNRGLKTPGVVPLLLFFGSLGFGYMMFEIGAMQIVNVYIGDPTYSLALILAGLLISTGIGSFMSAKFTKATTLSILVKSMLAITVALGLWTAFTFVVQPITMSYSLVTRCCITFLGLLPMGMLLGIPFPTAIQEIELHYPTFIAWAWGINGVASVLASVVAIIAAMNLGFISTILIAAVTYLLGMGAYLAYDRAQSAI